MALTVNRTTYFGLAVPNCYVRVSNMTIEHGDTDSLRIEARVYVSQQDYIAHKPHFDIVNASMPYVDTAALTLAEVYTFLKTLPDMVGAIDN